MRKSIGVFAVIGLLVISWLFIGSYAVSARATYYGFISCAQSSKLHYMHEVLIFEFIAFFFFLLLGVSRAFLLHNRIKILMPYFTAAMVFNLIVITYKVFEYPIVLRRDGVFSAVEEGSMRNPLFIVVFLHAILTVGWINLALKSFLSSKQRRIISFMILLLILAGLIFYSITKPVRCFG